MYKNQNLICSISFIDPKRCLTPIYTMLHFQTAEPIPSKYTHSVLNFNNIDVIFNKFPSKQACLEELIFAKVISKVCSRIYECSIIMCVILVYMFYVLCKLPNDALIFGGANKMPWPALTYYSLYSSF